MFIGMVVIIILFYQQLICKLLICLFIYICVQLFYLNFNYNRSPFTEILIEVIIVTNY